MSLYRAEQVPSMGEYYAALVSNRDEQAYGCLRECGLTPRQALHTMAEDIRSPVVMRRRSGGPKPNIGNATRGTKRK